MEAAGGAAAARWALRCALGLALLAALVVAIPGGAVLAALRGVPRSIWLAAPLAFLAVHLLGVVKWRLLVNAAGAGLGARVAARCYYAGLFGNLFLPSVVGGDAVRAALALRHSRSASGLLLASLVDRLLDVVALATLAGVAFATLPAAAAPTSRSRWAAVAVALLLAATLAGIAWRRLPVARLPRRVRRHLAEARRALRRLRGARATLVTAWLLGLALQVALLLLAFWLGGHAGVAAPFGVWVVVWPLAKLAALVPLTQG
ncbi:MAG: flippase-like domain-containing protein, partial [Thermoanaerobaculia bacterium]|nr:flippase-like domain-containing protein [Thermoanaerobaculia bacterium]